MNKKKDMKTLRKIFIECGKKENILNPALEFHPEKCKYFPAKQNSAMEN